MRWVILPLLILFLYAPTAHAEPIIDTIDNIEVPSGVTWGTQVKWQGHAITHVRKEGNRYIVEVARDSEPHEYPYFNVAFDLNWQYIGTTTRTDPAAIKKAEEEKKKAEEDAKKAEEEKAKQEKEKQERERQQPAPDPVVKPPEEEPAPEEPEEPEEEE